VCTFDLTKFQTMLTHEDRSALTHLFHCVIFLTKISPHFVRLLSGSLDNNSIAYVRFIMIYDDYRDPSHR
jgi:hypothetical protein